MARFAVGQTVWAGRDLITEASGDHPALRHARWGDSLLVVQLGPDGSMEYRVSRYPDRHDPFWCHSNELMGQAPLPGNNAGSHYNQPHPSIHR